MQALSPRRRNVTTLLDLPNELLYNIFSHASTRALLTFARLCRHLNHICLRYYLKEWGIDTPGSDIALRLFVSNFDNSPSIIHHILPTIPLPPPSSLSSPSFIGSMKSSVVDELDDQWENGSYQDWSFLAALRIAFDIRRVQSLTCHLDGLHAAQVSNKFIWTLDCLYDLIERLDYIGHISLCIAGTEYFPTWFHFLEDNRIKGRGGSSHPPSEAKAWARHYARLLDLIMKKAEKVELSHGRLPIHRHKFVRDPPSKTIVQKIRKLMSTRRPPPYAPYKLSGATWQLHWVDEWGHGFTEEDRRSVAPPKRIESRVQTLDIAGAILMLPPSIDWIHPLLCCSTLTDLSLSSMNLTGEIWSALIPKLSSSILQVQSLKIQKCHSLTSHLIISLIQSLNNLRTLELGSGTDEPTTRTSCPFSALPRLSHLSASPRWSLCLLGIRTHWPEVHSPAIATDGRPPDTERLPSLATLIVLRDGYRPFFRPGEMISIIQSLHVFLRPRRPIFRRLGFRSFRYLRGKIGLDDIPLFPGFLGSSIMEVDFLGFSMLNFVQLEYHLAAVLFTQKSVVEKWLRWFRCLEVLELRTLAWDQDDNCRRQKSEKYDDVHAQLVEMMKDILVRVYKWRFVELIIDGTVV